jgi:hypothetical protein
MPNQKEDPLKLLELFDMASNKAWIKWLERKKVKGV